MTRLPATHSGLPSYRFPYLGVDTLFGSQRISVVKFELEVPFCRRCLRLREAEEFSPATVLHRT